MKSTSEGKPMLRHWAILPLFFVLAVLSPGGAAFSSTCQGSAVKPPHCPPPPPAEPNVGRIITSGMEWSDATLEGMLDAPSLGTTTRLGNSAFSSTNPRSGSFALRRSAGGTSTTYGYDFALGTTYYARAYVYISAYPNAQAKLVTLGGSDIVVNTDGTLNLKRSATVIGSASTSAVPIGDWFLVEMGFMAQVGNDYAEARLNGASFASSAALTITDTAGADSFNVVGGDQAGLGWTVDYDDIALNDSAGANQNTWPGPGRIVLLKPISDNAGGTGWTLGTGTALGGNGFAAVDNTPPTGVADLAVGSDPKQLRNANSTANSNMDVNLTTYTNAGIRATDTINLLVPMVSTAAPVTTSAKQGTVGISSNPVVANIALAAGGTTGAFWSGTTAGTYPTGWKRSFGTTTYLPSVTMGTSPVMRVTQVTASTRIAMVSAMGVYVDYSDAPALLYSPYRQAAIIYHY